MHFMKAIQKMQKDHVAGQTGEGGNLTDLLITSLELAKTRLSAMHGEMRKIFLTILTTLIEKSPEAKLLKAMIKMVWYNHFRTILMTDNFPGSFFSQIYKKSPFHPFSIRFKKSFPTSPPHSILCLFLFRLTNGCEQRHRLRLPATYRPSVRSRYSCTE